MSGALVSEVLEVEAKYRVEDVGRLRVLEGHEVHLSDPVIQDDQAYAPAGWDYGQPKIGVAFGRLRTQLNQGQDAGRHIFTVKRPLTHEQSCVEFETEVADRDQMHAAVVAMGYAPTVRIVKTRRSGQVGR